MNDLNGYECEIRYYVWLENTSKFILGRKNSISAFFVVTLQKLAPPFVAGMSKCQASQLLFQVDFHAFLPPYLCKMYKSICI